MFCTKCGTELPDDSQFCRKCGQSLSNPQTAGSGAATAAAVAPAPTVAPKAQRSFWVYYILGVLAVVVLLGWFINRANNRQRSAFTAAQMPPARQLHRVKIGTGAITVNASNYAYFTLTVPAGATTVNLPGHFTAAGGSGNDIEVLVLNQDEYTNWQNGHDTPTLYNSGKVTAGEVNATLPSGAGTYYLVFNNKFSLLSPKAVEETIALT